MRSPRDLSRWLSRRPPILFIGLLALYLVIVAAIGCLFGKWSEAIYFATGVILVLYTVETHAMRKEMTRQNEQGRYILVEMTKTRSAQVLLPVLEILLKSAHRRWAVEKFPTEVAEWTQPQRDVANRLSMDLERIAYICDQGLLDPELVMGGHAPVFVSSWRHLNGFIADLRARTGQPQRGHFERFARACEEYLRRREG